MVGRDGTGPHKLVQGGLSQPRLLSPLPVQDAIRIVEQPESQVVAEGMRVSLSCRATGPPGLMYQWFCGRQEVRACPGHGGGWVRGSPSPGHLLSCRCLEPRPRSW